MTNILSVFSTSVVRSTTSLKVTGSYEEALRRDQNRP